MKHVQDTFTDLSVSAAEAFARRRVLSRTLAENRAILPEDMAGPLDDLATATAGPELFTPEVLGYVGDLEAALDDIIDQEGGGPSEVRSEEGQLCLVGGSATGRRLAEVRRALAALAEIGWRVADRLAAESALEYHRNAMSKSA